MSFFKMSAIGAASAALLVAILNPFTAEPTQSQAAAQTMAKESLMATQAIDSNRPKRQPKAALKPAIEPANHGVQLKTKAGDLIVTAALKDLFDFYLAHYPHLSQLEIQQLIKTELGHSLPQQSLQQGLTILLDYFAYKSALISFNQQYPANPTLKTQANLALLVERHEALIALQDRLMTPYIASIFFSSQRQLDGHTLAKAKILTSDLSEDGKQQALINLNAQLPFDAFQHQQRNNVQQSLRKIDQQSDLSAAEKYQLQAQLVGEESASRLAEVEQKRAYWRQRLDIFRGEVQDLQASGLARQDYQDAYQKLLTRHFQPHEYARAKAIIRSNQEQL